MKTLARMTTLVATLAGMLIGPASAAAVIGGIDFPQGTASFADAVVSFTPGTGPAAAFLDPDNALGPPDVDITNGQACYLNPTTSNCLFTSLGEAGTLVLQFTDNTLTGSSASGTVTGAGDGFNDLWVFEVGVAESTSVEISADNNTWYSVGNIGGGGTSIGVFSYGFDIDKLGFGYTDSFTYVRIKDLLIDPGTSPEGADIDAVGAIQTVVPAPGAAWLLPAGLVLGRWARRRRYGTSSG